MNLISNNWLQKKCFIFDGIFFSDDTIIPISINNNVYSIGIREKISNFISVENDDIAQYSIKNEIRFEEYCLKIGDSPYEGCTEKA